MLCATSSTVVMVLLQGLMCAGPRLLRPGVATDGASVSVLDVPLDTDDRSLAAAVRAHGRRQSSRTNVKPLSPTTTCQRLPTPGPNMVLKHSNSFPYTSVKTVFTRCSST